jgi:hypothetical protein
VTWVSLLPAEARVAVRRPTTRASAALMVVFGFALGLLLGGQGGALSIVGAAAGALVGGIQYGGVIVAILVGAAVGGEDDDLGTGRDLWLSHVPP